MEKISQFLYQLPQVAKMVKISADEYFMCVGYVRFLKIRRKMKYYTTHFHNLYHHKIVFTISITQIIHYNGFHSSPIK